MKTEIENAIKELAKKGGSSENVDDAIRFTQAALNLALTLARLNGMDEKH